MRKFLKILILTFLGAVTITSCSDDSDGIPGWPWNDNSTEKPDEPDVAEAKPRYIWIDAAANFPDYANSKENIAKDMEKIKRQDSLILLSMYVPLQEMYYSILML